jgi:hypothetical protein
VSRRKTIGLWGAAAAFITCAAVAGFYWYAGWYGLNVIARRGGSVWVAITPNDPRISQSMRVALQAAVPQAQVGAFEWIRRAEGLETTELPVMADQHDKLITAGSPTELSSPMTPPVGLSSVRPKKHFSRWIGWRLS